MPITQDEVTAGAELSPLHAMRLTGWAQGRSLRRGLALTPDGFDNPGRDLGQDASRNTALLGVEVATAPAGKLVLRIGYMYGHAEGSWTGLASTDFEFVTQNLVATGKIGGCGTSGAASCGATSGAVACESWIGCSSMMMLFARPTGTGVASTSSWRANVVKRAGASTRYAVE